VKFEYQGRSHKGLIREKNEDVFYCPPESGKPNLLILADGMGGRYGGDVAAETAVTALTDFFRKKEGQQYSPGQALIQGIALANRAILNRARKQPSLLGMCTTVVVALPQEYGFLLAHVGDSRAYLYHRGVLEQRTRDHSLVWEMMEQGVLTQEEARSHPHRNVITRALGAGKTVEAEVTRVDCEPGDLLMICSDGLSEMCSEREMARVLACDLSLQEMATELIRLANVHGGPDNITVLLALCRGGDDIA